MNRMKLVAALSLLMTSPQVGAADRLVIRVSPSVAFAPANLVVRAFVTADSNNRTMTVVAESSEFYRSSEIQLEGDKAPRTTVFEFRSVPGGQYDVTATLLGSRGEELGSALSHVNVIVPASGGF